MYNAPAKYNEHLKARVREIARRGVKTPARFKILIEQEAGRQISGDELAYCLYIADYEWRKIGWTKDSDGKWCKYRGISESTRETSRNSSTELACRVPTPRSPAKRRRLETKQNTSDHGVEAGTTKTVARSSRSKGDFLDPKVYVLELEGGNYYVGRCTNFPIRVKRHIEGNGSLWTKLHRPVATDAFFWGGKEVEKSVTLHYMAKYGINKVRGWVFCKGDLYDEGSVAWQISRCRRPTPIEKLRVCDALRPMRLESSPKWNVNRLNLDPGPLHDSETIF